MPNVTLYVVEATSLEMIRRRQTPNEALFPRNAESRYNSMDPVERPVAIDMGRFFDRGAAEEFMSRLDKSWFRPRIREVVESLSAQHHAHGGDVGK